MGTEDHAQRKMNDFVDVISFANFFINLREVFMHQFEHVSLKILEFINADFGVEDSLISEK